MAAKMARPSKSDDCVIPTRPKPELLRASLVESSPREEGDIARYFESQSSKDTKGPAYVEHLELVKSETVFGREYKVWDVHATDGRWWVVTNPTNLYSQEHIPSLDFVLSLHVGLMARVASRDSRRAQARILNGSRQHGVAGSKPPRRSTARPRQRASSRLE
jgi:hypothetical protein